MEQLWACPPGTRTIQHFFLMQDITVAHSAYDIISGGPRAKRTDGKKWASALPAAEIHARSRYMDIYTGTRDDFRPLF